MNTQLKPSREDDTTLGPADSPGKRLRIARQSQGMTQERVADELHLRPAIIEALERQDFTSLPEPVFIAGYVRKYAYLVGLDPESMVAAYGTPPVRARTNSTVARADRRQIDGRRIGASHKTMGLIGVGILILAGILTFLWQQYQRPDPGLGTTAAEEVTQGTAPADVLDRVPESELSAFPADPKDLLTDQEMDQSPEPGSDSETSQPQLPTTAAATEDAAEANADDGKTAAIAPRTGEETEETIAAESGEIELIFNGPCWVDVRDSEQKYKLFGAMKKGDRYVLEGKPPHAFILGNVATVQVMVGGKPLDLSTVSRGSVALFKLDANGKIR